MRLAGRRIVIFLTSLGATLAIGVWLARRPAAVSTPSMEETVEGGDRDPERRDLPSGRGGGGRRPQPILPAGRPARPGAAAIAGEDFRSLPVVTAQDIYDRNPRLIPSFHSEGKKHYRDPEIVKAWHACGREYAARNDVPLGGEADIELAYTLRVSGGKAQVLGLDRIEGGDDDLADCLWRAQTWFQQPFEAEGAKDGTFRWSMRRTIPLVPPS